MSTCAHPGCGRDARGGLRRAHQARARLGIEMDAPVRAQLTKADRERLLPRVRLLLETGATYIQIAAETGVPTDTLAHWCQRYSIQAPPAVPHDTPSG